MANRFYRSSNLFSFEKDPVMLVGSFAITDLGAAATLLDNGITYTAQEFGAAGNSITVALVAGGTAGAEVVTVTGTAISVAIQSGVSTRTQVKTAIDGSAAAAALVSVSVTSGGTAATLLAATALASGDDMDVTATMKGASLSQVGTGIMRLTLQDKYVSLLHCGIMLGRSSAGVDLVPQIKTELVSTSKTIDFRLLAGSTATDPAVGDVIYMKVILRNSSLS